MRGALALALLASVLVAPGGHARAQRQDPDLQWLTVETRHFRVHYHEPLGVVARHVAAVAERAHGRLAPALDHAPDERTEVVLTDGSEGANGSATVLPRNEIRLFATAPGDLSPLGDYDDWQNVLVTHEHVHILHLDTIGGIPALINSIFGKIYAPNNVQPRWFIEGLATWEESRQSAGGRMRSSMFEMYIRMHALDGELLRMDQLSNDVDRWPRGNTWYLYGSRFIDYIVDRYGYDAIREISHDYGDSTVPYGLNRISERATGKSFVTLYEEFREHQREHHGRVAEAVRERGLRVGRRLTDHGESARSPRFLDADTVAYWVADGHTEGQIRAIDAHTGERRGELVRTSGEAYLAPGRSGRHVYYNSLDGHRDLYRLYDLFRYDRRTGERVRLTEGRRAREPDLSPDGRRIAYVRNGAGTRHLMIADPSDIEGTERVLVRSRRFEQVFTPRFSPDGEHVAFSAWQRGGYRDIRIVDLQSGQIEDVTHDRAMDTGPAWSPDGQWLYFSSDRTGIANVYAYHLESGRLRQVTNVVGGAYHPAPSPDGERLVYLGYGSDGFDLFAIDLDPSRYLEAPPYVDARPPPSDVGGRVPELTSEPYRPYETLAPRAFQIDLSSGAFGQELGLEFTGGDMVGFHSYTGRVSIPFDQPDPSASLRWVWRRWPVPIDVRLFRRVAPRGGLEVGGERRQWIEDSYGGEIGVFYRFFRSFHSETVRLSYSLTDLNKLEPFGGELDPNDPPPVLPETGLLARLRLRWAWSDVQRETWDISASAGQRIALALSAADPLLGSDFRSVSLSWSLSKYIENPWVRHHVLALRYGGGISGGDLGRRGLFSVGGFPDLPFQDALLDDVTLGGVALRGFPPFSRSGTQFQLLQTEYRFPIIRPMFGVRTLPAYVSRLYGSVFFDVGDAYFGKLDPSTFRYGVGGEILLDFTLGYFVNLTLRQGFAWGFGPGGGAQYYANIGVPF